MALKSTVNSTPLESPTAKAAPKTIQIPQWSRGPTVYELYEDNKIQDNAQCLFASSSAAHGLVSEVVTAALDKIVENDMRKRVPGNIIDALDTYLLAGLEVYYKNYDFDDEKDIKEIADPDEEPAPIAMDTWGRGNVNNVKPNQMKIIEEMGSPVKIPDFREQTRRDLRIATEKAQKYLKEIDEAKLPKPIPLNEKVDEIGADEIEIRLKKERQIKEKKEKEKRDAELLQKQRDQEKMVAAAAKNAAGDMASLITYTYDGQLLITNPKGAKEKLNSVVLPTNVTLKKPEAEATQTEASTRPNRSKEKKEIVVLPGLKKVNKNIALEEAMAKTTYTTPNLNDIMTLTGGVTLVQNGRTKTNMNRQELRFNQTGTIRMNKTDYARMVEQKRILRDKRLGEQRNLKKKQQGKKLGVEELDSTKKLEQSDAFDEDIPFESKTMKVSSMKQLKALHDLTGYDNTLTTFNQTITEARRRKEREDRERLAQETFMQTNTDTFNLEIMRGTVDTNMKKMNSTQMLSIRPPKDHHRKADEDKITVLPRNRSQKVLRPNNNVKDLMTPPVLGGASGHSLFNIKTTHNFFINH
jgi:hypothetical protein